MVQIQEVAGLLGGAITSTMLALASVRLRLQQAAIDLGQEMATEVVLVIQEMDGVASTQLGHALHLADISFNSLSKERRGPCPTG